MMIERAFLRVQNEPELKPKPSKPTWSRSRTRVRGRNRAEAIRSRTRVRGRRVSRPPSEAEFFLVVHLTTSRRVRDND